MKRFFNILFLVILLGALSCIGYYTWNRSAAEQKRLDETASRINDLQQLINNYSQDIQDETILEEETELPGGLSVAESPETEILSLESSSESVYEEMETDTEMSVPSDHKIIFVGDSRTVGMGDAVQDDCIYIGEVGEGYNWMIEYGIDLMDEAITANPDVPVVFNLGVNDCDAIEAYIELYTVIMASYSDTSFYIMSVNPVTEESLTVPDSDVIAFNEKMLSAFPDQFIDSYSWMQENGYESVDGVHYSWKQYRRIHHYAVTAVLEMEKNPLRIS